MCQGRFSLAGSGGRKETAKKKVTICGAYDGPGGPKTLGNALRLLEPVRGIVAERGGKGRETS